MLSCSLIHLLVVRAAGILHGGCKQCWHSPQAAKKKLTSRPAHQGRCEQWHASMRLAVAADSSKTLAWEQKWKMMDADGVPSDSRQSTGEANSSCTPSIASAHTGHITPISALGCMLHMSKRQGSHASPPAKTWCACKSVEPPFPRPSHTQTHTPSTRRISD